MFAFPSQGYIYNSFCHLKVCLISLLWMTFFIAHRCIKYKILLIKITEISAATITDYTVTARFLLKLQLVNLSMKLLMSAGCTEPVLPAGVSDACVYCVE